MTKKKLAKAIIDCDVSSPPPSSPSPHPSCYLPLPVPSPRPPPGSSPKPASFAMFPARPVARELFLRASLLSLSPFHSSLLSFSRAHYLPFLLHAPAFSPSPAPSPLPSDIHLSPASSWEEEEVSCKVVSMNDLRREREKFRAHLTKIGNLQARGREAKGTRKGCSSWGVEQKEYGKGAVCGAHELPW